MEVKHLLVRCSFYEYAMIIQCHEYEITTIRLHTNMWVLGKGMIPMYTGPAETFLKTLHIMGLKFWGPVDTVEEIQENEIDVYRMAEHTKVVDIFGEEHE